MLFSSVRYPKTFLLRSSTVFKSGNKKRIKIFKMILREEMKYDKNEHTKSHRQRPVGACDAGLADAECCGTAKKA